MRRVLAVGVLSLAVLAAVAPAAAQSDASQTGVDASQVCSEHHKFGGQPVDVAKTADGAIVLAQIAWNWHDAIGCYLTLDEAATAVLRDSLPPTSLPSGKTAASQLCSEHHEFGVNPVDVAKAARGPAVLARLVWNWHDSIGCYLTLDAEAVETLRAVHAAANAPDPTPDPTPEQTPDPTPDPTPEQTPDPDSESGEHPGSIYGWVLDSGETDTGAWWPYDSFADPADPDSSPGIAGGCYADNTRFNLLVWSDTPITRSTDDESVAVSIDLGGVSGEARWWAADEDERMVIFPPDRFLVDLLDAGPVALRLVITDDAGRRQSLSFDMAGFAEVITYQSEHCPVPIGWEHFETENEDGAIWGYWRYGTRVGTAGSGQWLYARCYADNTTFSLFVGSDTPMKTSSDDESVTVTHRLGGPLGEARWWAADNGEQMAIHPPRWLIGELAAAGPVMLSLDITDAEGRIQSLEFDMTGFAEAVDHMAQHCPVPGIGSDDDAITVPPSEPSGRCAAAVGAGVYQWEQCAWAQYKENRVFNRPLSEAEARTLIARIWAEIDVAGKPSRPPTSEQVPAGSECADVPPSGSGITIACYQPWNHHIRRLDAFLKTLLHETAHALVAGHSSIQSCRGITDDDDYQACVHNDIFRCVANHLYVRYAGIPDTGVCGTAPQRQTTDSQATGWRSNRLPNGAYAASVDATWHTRPFPYEDSDIRLAVFCHSDGDIGIFFYFDEGILFADTYREVSVAHIFLPQGYFDWPNERQSEYVTANRVNATWYGDPGGGQVAGLFERFHVEFVNDAVRHADLVIQARNSDGSNFGLMSFSLDGAHTHIRPVTEQCGWTWS